MRALAGAPPRRPPLEAVEAAALPRPIPFTAPWDELTGALPADGPSEPTLTMACLGHQGSWGNAVLQYVFLRCFSRAQGFHWQTPRWIGSAILDQADPPLSFRPPVVVGDGFSAHCAVFDRQAPFDRDLLRAQHLAATRGRRYLLLRQPALASSDDLDWPFRHADLEGFFFARGGALAPHRELVQSLFRPAPAIAERAQAAVATLRAAAGTLVGIHVRRSDFLTSGLVQSFELVTPTATYREWLDGIWPSLDRPRLLVCSDSPGEVLPAFARYQPITAAELGFTIDGLVAPEEHAWSRGDHGVARAPGFYPDWYLLSQCDMVAISNSSFSFSACLANARARRFMRPTFPTGALERFDPWQSEPLLFLPPTRSLPGLAAQRLRLTIRGLRGEAARYWWRSGGAILGAYLDALRWRALTCLRVRGTSRLARELLSPGFYWRAERRYLGAAGPPRRGEPGSG